MTQEMNQQTKMEIIYFQVADLWKRLCERHTDLLDYTCDEYSLLLQSKIEEIEELLTKKQSLIDEILQLENLRKNIIDDLNSSFALNINNVSDLIKVMREHESKNNQQHLYRFNELLIDLIQKIQSQNKKNQMFINRALLSLKEIREDAIGTKGYSTYNSQGSTISGALNS